MQSKKAIEKSDRKKRSKKAIEKSDRKKLSKKALSTNPFFMDSDAFIVMDPPSNKYVAKPPPQRIEEWIALPTGGFIRSAIRNFNIHMFSPGYVHKKVSWQPGTKDVQRKSTRKCAIGSLFTSEDSPLATANIRNAIRPAIFSRLSENDQARLLKLLPTGESITDALENPHIQEAIQTWQQSLANGQLDPEVVMQLKKSVKSTRRSATKIVCMEQAFKDAGYQYTEADGWHKREKRKRSAVEATPEKRHALTATTSTVSPNAAAATTASTVSSSAVEDDMRLAVCDLADSINHTGFKLRIRMWHRAEEAWLTDNLPEGVASILGDVYPTDDEEEATCFCGKLHVSKANEFSVLEENWVACDVCGKWCHTLCAGIDDDVDASQICYICPRCDKESSKVPRKAKRKGKAKAKAISSAGVSNSMQGKAKAVSKQSTVMDIDSDDDDVPLSQLMSSASGVSTEACDLCDGAAAFTGPLPVKLLRCFCGKHSRHIMCYKPDFDTTQPEPKGYCCSAHCRISFGGKDLSRFLCSVCNHGPITGLVECCKCAYNKCHLQCLQSGVKSDEFICQECEEVLATGEYDM